jgi:hypothetical protein
LTEEPLLVHCDSLIIQCITLRHGAVACTAQPFVIHLYTYLRQKLIEAFPDADDDTIRDTLEGITTLHELIAEIIRSALVDEALQTGSGHACRT